MTARVQNLINQYSTQRDAVRAERKALVNEAIQAGGPEAAHVVRASREFQELGIELEALTQQVRGMEMALNAMLQ